MSDLATAIRVAREEADMTQGELARRAGITPSYVSRIEAAAWERGGPWPSADVLRALARALNQSSTRLIELRRIARQSAPVESNSRAWARPTGAAKYGVSLGDEDVHRAAQRLLERNPPRGSVRLTSQLFDEGPGGDGAVESEFTLALGRRLAEDTAAVLYRMCVVGPGNLDHIRATTERLAVGRDPSGIENIRTARVKSMSPTAGNRSPRARLQDAARLSGLRLDRRSSRWTAGRGRKPFERREVTGVDSASTNEDAALCSTDRRDGLIVAVTGGGKFAMQVVPSTTWRSRESPGPFAQQDTQFGRCADIAAWICHYAAHLRGDVMRRPIRRRRPSSWPAPGGMARRGLDDIGAVVMTHAGNLRYVWALGDRSQRRRTPIAVPPAVPEALRRLMIPVSTPLLSRQKRGSTAEAAAVAN